MSNFKGLLGDLAQTCQDLERVKAEHSKDHENISRSFEKALFSILKQEQHILTQVEDEHRRLKDQLSSIQEANELTLQNGVIEINSIVQEISTISSQVKQMLATSGDSDPAVKAIQRRVANIFARKKKINVTLQKVQFIPNSRLSLKLGEIHCERQSLGFSIPVVKSKGLSGYDGNSNSVLLSDEKPPWEDIPGGPDDGNQNNVGQEQSPFIHKQVKVSPREQAVREADKAALSPRTATNIWISDLKNNPSGKGLLSGTRNGAVKISHEEHIKEIRSHATPTKTLTNGSQAKFNIDVGSVRVNTGCHRSLVVQNKSTNPVGTIKLASTSNDPQHVIAPLSLKNNSKLLHNYPNIENIASNGHLPADVPDHSTLFKATTAYVCEDSSDDGLDERNTGVEKDPKVCREVALRESRVPSAKKNDNGEHSIGWMSVDTSSYTDSNDENPKLSSCPIVSVTAPEETLPLTHLPSEWPSRPVSPADSVKSSYTFIIESPRKDTADGTRKPRSFIRLASKESRKFHPVINSTKEPSPKNVTAPRSKHLKQVQSTGNLSGSHQLVTNSRKKALQVNSSPRCVTRSASMPYIGRTPRQVNSKPNRPGSASDRRDSSSSTSSCWSNSKNSINSGLLVSCRTYGRPSQNRVKSARSPRKLNYKGQSLSKSESNLVDFQKKQKNVEKPKGLVRQFGKFGSGRAELNLPHGLYATKAGSLYVVDYGNRRLQIMNVRGKILQQIALEAKNYFDVAVSNRGLVALTNSTDRTVEVYNKHGRLLQVISKNFGAPRGITTSYQDDFIVADMKMGTICSLTLNSVTGIQKESTIVPGFNKPYLVASNSQGLLAVTERGLDGGCCVKVLSEDWQILKILGVKDSPGPKILNPWGVGIDSEGGVLVADWGKEHSVIYYPPRRPGKILVAEGLSSPRGLALWQDSLLMVADSMHNCIKVFQYQEV